MNWFRTQIVLVDAASTFVEFAVNGLLQSTLLIAVGLTIARLLRHRGSAVQSVVYRTTLAAVLICPLATWGLSQAGVSGWSLEMPQGWSYVQADVVVTTAEVEPQLRDAPSEITETVLTPALPAESLPFIHESATAEEASAFEPAPVEIETAQTSDVPPVIAEPPVEESAATLPPTFSLHRFGVAALAVAVLWLCVSFALTARLATAWWRSGRLRRCSLPADSEVMRECHELASVLGVSTPDVLRSPYLPSPCLLGLRRPVVLLPEGELDLSLRDALIHELAHLRRHDCHWNLLRQVVTAWFFFQPLLWKLSRRVEATAEEVCDDYVITHGGNRQGYAHQLVDIAELSTAPIAAAGVGIVSLRSMLASRVTRIMDTSRTLSTRAGNLLLVAVLVGGLASTTIVGLVGLSPRHSQAEAETGVVESDTEVVDEGDAEDTVEVVRDDDLITVRGKVLGPDGQPFAGATVSVIKARTADIVWTTTQEIVRQTESAEDGSYSFQLPNLEGDILGKEKLIRQHYEFVAQASGLAPDYQSLGAVRRGDPIDLKLSEPGIPFEGRVVDLEGQPIAGVRVTIRIIRTPQEVRRVNEWVEKASKNPRVLTEEYFKPISKDRPQIAHFPWHKRLAMEGLPLIPDVVTGTDGKFRFEELGTDCYVTMQIEGPTIATGWINAVTRDMKPVPLPMGDPRYAAQVCYGAKFDILAAPTQIIHGVVRDLDTQQPLEGQLVQVHQFGNSLLGIHGFVSATTDERGQYELVGLPKPSIEGRPIDLRVIPSADSPYFRTEIEVPKKGGLDTVQCDIELKRGIWLTGQVIDQQTGEPQQARVSYLPFLDNDAAKGYENFNPGIRSIGQEGYYPTTPEGIFRIPAIAGRGVVTAIAREAYRYRIGVGADKIEDLRNDKRLLIYHLWGTDHTNSIREVNVASGSTETSIDLELVPHNHRVFEIQDSAAEPLSGVRVIGQFPRSSLSHSPHWSNVIPQKDHQVSIFGLDLDQRRPVLFLHKEKREGVAKILSSTTSGPIQLLPCATITGRLINSGSPVDASAYVAFDMHGQELPQTEGDAGFLVKWRYSPVARVDSEGYFRLDQIIPGVKYTIRAMGVTRQNTLHAQRLIRETEVIQPGEIIDLGTIDISTDERPEPVRKKAVEDSDTPVTATTEEDNQELTTDQVPKQAVVAGRITLVGDKPVAGAHVAVIAMRIGPSRSGDFASRGQVLAEGVTNEDGLYRLNFSGANSKTHRHAKVIARKDGAAVAWQGLNLDAASTEASLELPPEELIVGRLVDIEGQSAAGVRLSVRGVMKKTDDGTWSHDGAGYRGGEPVPAAWLSPVASDDQGWFTIRGIPAGYGVFLDVVGGDRFAPQDILLNSGMPEQRGERDGTYRALVKNVSLGEELVLPLAPAQLFEGVVTYEDTGEPAPHARLTIWASQQEEHGSMISVAGTADAEGRYRISPKPGIRFGVTAYAPDGTPYLARKTPLDEAIRWHAGDRVRKVNITLPRGVLVRGKIVEAESNEPIAGASLQYLRGPGNSNTSNDIRTGWQAIQVSNEQGEFEIAVLPGPGLLLVHGPSNEYVIQHTTTNQISRGRPGGERQYAHHIQKIDVSADQTPVEMSFELHRGGTVHGTLVDETGESVDEASLISWRNIHATNLGWRGHSPTVLGGRFEMGGLVEGEEYPVFFLSAKRRIGATVMVRADEPTPRVVLMPCGSAVMRFVDDAGKPVANQRTCDVRMVARAGAHGSNRLVMMAGGEAADSDFISNVDRLNNPDLGNSDGEGRFGLPALIPGATYRIITYGDGMSRIAKEFVAEAGTTTDLGDIVVEAKEE